MSDKPQAPSIITPSPTRRMKPVGSHPVEIDGITMRRSNEVPAGMQALYNEMGQLLWVGFIGTNPRLNSCRHITLNPKDYEIALRTHLDEGLRAQNQRFKQ